MPWLSVQFLLWSSKNALEGHLRDNFKKYRRRLHVVSVRAHSGASYCHKRVNARHEAHHVAKRHAIKLEARHNLEARFPQFRRKLAAIAYGPPLRPVASIHGHLPNTLRRLGPDAAPAERGETEEVHRSLGEVHWWAWLAKAGSPLLPVAQSIVGGRGAAVAEAHLHGVVWNQQPTHAYHLWQAARLDKSNGVARGIREEPRDNVSDVHGGVESARGGIQDDCVWHERAKRDHGSQQGVCNIRHPVSHVLRSTERKPRSYLVSIVHVNGRSQPLRLVAAFLLTQGHSES
mmetsp:Transcript_54839/g.160031  ORF Transcript_54839/g.160031 Transcript_54839/m.160031 type:complete len:289 (+) Transcript_54839:360-1226(+)